MSSKIWLSLGASITLLAACATQQENPNYAYSTKYKAGSQTSSIQTSPVSYQSGATTTYASASTASEAYSRTDQDCLRRETDKQREIDHSIQIDNLQGFDMSAQKI